MRYNLLAFLERYIILEDANARSSAQSSATSQTVGGLQQRVASLEHRADHNEDVVTSLGISMQSADGDLHDLITRETILRDIQIHKVVEQAITARMADVRAQSLKTVLLEERVGEVQAKQQQASTLEERLSSLEARFAEQRIEQRISQRDEERLSSLEVRFAEQRTEQRIAQRDEELKQAHKRIAELEAALAKTQLAAAEPVLTASASGASAGGSADDETAFAASAEK